MSSLIPQTPTEGTPFKQKRRERRGTAEDWLEKNPVLAEGEIGIELAEFAGVPPRVKIGDGVTEWMYLPYFAGDGSGGGDGRSIVSIVQTSGSGAPGSLEVYTITYSDGTKSTFDVLNGPQGPMGPAGPVGPGIDDVDLPDFTLIFENGLI